MSHVFCVSNAGSRTRKYWTSPPRRIFVFPSIEIPRGRIATWGVEPEVVEAVDPEPTGPVVEVGVETAEDDGATDAPPDGPERPFEQPTTDVMSALTNVTRSKSPLTVLAPHR
jgi:hypothetical protein